MTDPRWYDNESQARTEVVALIKPVFGNCALFVAERNRLNAGMKEVFWVARVPKDDTKSEAAVNAVQAFTNSIGFDRLTWEGTKMDFLNDNETEYIMIKTVVSNGF